MSFNCGWDESSICELRRFWTRLYLNECKTVHCERDVKIVINIKRNEVEIKSPSKKRITKNAIDLRFFTLFNANPTAGFPWASSNEKTVYQFLRNESPVKLEKKSKRISDSTRIRVVETVWVDLPVIPNNCPLASLTSCPIIVPTQEVLPFVTGPKLKSLGLMMNSLLDPAKVRATEGEELQGKV